MEIRAEPPVKRPTEALSDWYGSPMGAAIGQVLASGIGLRVDDAFGYHAVLLGASSQALSQALAARLRIRRITQVATLATDIVRVPNLSGDISAPALVMGVVADYAQLPIDSAAADLVIALHVLENRREPHELLREIDRTVHPEGRLLIVGVNPASLWHGQRWLGARCHSPLSLGHHHAAWRVVDWLRVLGYEVRSVDHHGGVCPLCRLRVFQKMQAMRQFGQSWLWFLQGFYVIDAVRRVSTPTAIRPAFRLRTLLPNKVPAAVAGNTAVGGRWAEKFAHRSPHQLNKKTHGLCPKIAP
jgi:SAM-dependent methyltransferase